MFLVELPFSLAHYIRKYQCVLSVCIGLQLIIQIIDFMLRVENFIFMQK